MKYNTLIAEAEKILANIAKKYFVCRDELEKRLASCIEKNYTCPDMVNLENEFANYLYRFINHEHYRRIYFFYDIRIRKASFYPYYAMLCVERGQRCIFFRNSREVIECYLKNHPELTEQEPLPVIETDTFCGFYSDAYVVNGIGCLVTGHGKSKAIRRVPGCEDIVLDFGSITLEKDCVTCGGHRLQYFVDMIGDYEINRERIDYVDADEYIKYARGNYRCGSMDDAYIEALVHECEKRGVKFVLVPWCESLEKKVQALTDFFSSACSRE